MEFKDAVAAVESSDVFASSPSTYLAHGFLSPKQGEFSEWQVGYYDSKKDTIAPYRVTRSGVLSERAAQVFKEEGSVLPLILSDVKIPHVEAISYARTLLKELHPGHPVMKEIVLIQQLPLGQVFNITLVTQTFNMFNVKLDAATGDVRAKEFSSLMSLSEN